ncbi:MAG: DUF1289 domain-containing protein [Chitinophagales bacterium]|nr:DUF1289 domain-containing protein [Hyphomicrobiales bacterium]
MGSSKISREAVTTPTPCIGVCQLDIATGFCIGCARTAQEIGLWRDASPAVQRAILEALPKRHAVLKGRNAPREDL